MFLRQSWGVVTWSVITQEKDLRLVPDESDGKDISVYLGLAAAAFLLVMLYPSDSTSEHDISLRPAQLSPAGTAQEPASRKGSGRLRLPQSAATPFANESADTGISALGVSSACRMATLAILPAFCIGRHLATDAFCVPCNTLHSCLAQIGQGLVAGSSRMTRNRDSSTSLNLWLGVDAAAEPAPTPKTSVQVASHLDFESHLQSPHIMSHFHSSTYTDRAAKSRQHAGPFLQHFQCWNHNPALTIRMPGKELSKLIFECSTYCTYIVSLSAEPIERLTDKLLTSEGVWQDVAQRMPAALLVVFVGMVVAIVQYPTVVRALRLGPSAARIIVPTLDEWRTGVAHFLAPYDVASCRPCMHACS